MIKQEDSQAAIWSGTDTQVLGISTQHTQPMPAYITLFLPEIRVPR